MIEKLQESVNDRKEEILSWLAEKKKGLRTPIYSSFDIRDNGVKAAIVDSNLFPGGFNNLTDEAKKEAVKHFKERIAELPDSKDILLVPEAHTRNEYYLSNLCALKMILKEAGYNVILGNPNENADEIVKVVDSKGHELTLEKMRNENGHVLTKSFSGGLILLNNDFSVAAPKLLQNVKDVVLPPLKLSWAHRKKYTHFKQYCKITSEFSDFLGVDHWLLYPMTEEVDDVSFGEKKGLQKVAEEVDKMISELNKKYEEYGIKEDPFVFVKDNSGTYGMGITVVHSGREVLELNSKGRSKMKFGKQKTVIDSVIIQEGISTKYKTKEGHVAEPVLYAVAGKVVGGFMRVHSDKDERSNLNSPGMKFDTLLKADITCPIIGCVNEKEELPFYDVLAQLANIAVGMEEKES